MSELIKPKKVLGFGRGLYPDRGSCGTIYRLYKGSEDVVNAIGQWWYFMPEEVRKLSRVHLTGGFPDLASQGVVKRPPSGINEARLKKNLLVRRWSIPADKITEEGDSGHTFANFTNSVERNLLIPGEFTPDRPLLAATCPEHRLRVMAIGQQALGLDENSLYFLPSKRPPEGILAARERWLTALTIIALRDVQAEPGNIEHTKQALQRFGELYEEQIEINLREPGLRPPITSTVEMPAPRVLDYPGAPKQAY